MYSTHNEGISVVAERFIRTLKNIICKCRTSVSKNVYLDKLDIVHKYSYTYSTIRLRPVDVKSSTCIDFDKKNNKKDPKFKVDDHVSMSKYKSIFAKGYAPIFVITKIKNTVP